MAVLFVDWLVQVLTQGYHIVQAGFEFTVHPKLALNTDPSARITGLCQHVWLKQGKRRCDEVSGKWHAEGWQEILKAHIYDDSENAFSLTYIDHCPVSSK